MNVTTYFDFVIIMYFIEIFYQVRHVECICYLLTIKPTEKRGLPNEIIHGIKAKTT